MALPMMFTAARKLTERVAEGLGGFAESHRVVEAAKLRQAAAMAVFDEKLAALRTDCNALERQQHVVMGSSFARFVELWERQKQRMKVSDKDFQVKLNLAPAAFEQFQGVSVTSLELGKGAAQSVVAGVATGAGAVAAATAVGSASTGVALTTLSGAAAHSALLAFFGGGSLAAGGLGMAGGTLVLGGIFVAPAAAVAALIASSKGHEALTKAHEYSAQIDVGCTSLEAKCADIKGIQHRVSEVSRVIDGLDRRLFAQVRLCEDNERRSDVNPEDEMLAFFKAGTLATTLSKVLSVPVFNDQLEVNPLTLEAVEKADAVLEGGAA